MTAPAPATSPATPVSLTPQATGGSATAAQPVGDRSARTRRILAYVLLIGYALLMFVPFVWTIVTSLKTSPDAVRLTFIPDPITFQGWDTAFNGLSPGLLQLFFNSALIAAVVTITNVFLGAMAGYAFARLRFPGRELLFILVLATLMIPDQMRLVPVYQVLVFLGLVNDNPTNYLGVVVVLAISASSIFLIRQYFLTIPRDLEEAAKIDGAGFFTTFWRVMLPLATPALAAVAILQFQGTWNGFFWPLIVLQTPDHWTLPLGLFQFIGFHRTDWPPLMAVVVMATLPIVILYIFFQRYFVEGIAASGVKG
jgi:multiple sugar transport system permease protein